MRLGRSRGRPEPGPPRSRSAPPTPTRGMTMRTAGKDRGSGPRPVERPCQRAPARRRRGRAGRPRPARRRGRRRADRSRRNRLRPAPGRRSGRLAQVAPRFALTFRAMSGTRQDSAPARGRSVLALSVLALLALGCFPLFAHADSSGIEYTERPPTATGKNTIPTQNGTVRHTLPRRTAAPPFPATMARMAGARLWERVIEWRTGKSGTETGERRRQPG